MKNSYEIQGDVTVIYLKRKDGSILETIIDTVDLEVAKEFPNTWCACWNKYARSFYVAGNVKENGKRVTTMLHRWLMETKELHVDHINHDTLNNRRSTNLRETTHQQNQQNRIDCNINSKSGIRGVSWEKRKKKWLAQIKIKGKIIRIGRFADIKDAEIAVIEARKIYYTHSLAN